MYPYITEEASHDMTSHTIICIQYMFLFNFDKYGQFVFQVGH